MSARRLLARSPYDREILGLALAALGSLAAEPLYILVDTAIVGHLGREELAALGIAAIVLSGLFALFNFLAYGTTSQVARADGAGQREIADRLGAQAFWLSLGIGVVLAGVLAVFAEPVVEVMGADGRTAELAVEYVRISCIGLPCAFLALGGQGYLRGVGDLKTPLVILVAANAVNLVLEVLFVYGFDWGLAGSAWGTVLAQLGMGAGFVVVLARIGRELFGFRLDLVRRLLRVGRHIFVRTAALYSSFVVAGAVLTRFGDASIAAHQIAFEIWVFLALMLDAIAIAGQVIVGRMLGAGDDQGAYAASARMISLAVLTGTVFAGVMLALIDLLPRVFTGDSAVLEEARDLWPIFALMQPLNGAVFALDGILIGAGDVRYLMWSMLAAGAASVSFALLALELDWGIAGVWLALLVLIFVRLVTLGARFTRRRWLVTGWA